MLLLSVVNPEKRPSHPASQPAPAKARLVVGLSVGRFMRASALMLEEDLRLKGFLDSVNLHRDPKTRIEFQYKPGMTYCNGI